MPQQTVFSERNKLALLERFLHVKDRGTAILELGVSKHGIDSSTYVFLNNKKQRTYYVGIDDEDKSYLNDPVKNVYTIKNTKDCVEDNMRMCTNLGITSFNFIFINACDTLNEIQTLWKYTNWLAPVSFVGFHNTGIQTELIEFLDSINRDKWNVVKNVCKQDNGIGFVWPKF
jgi:hypothetical protein